MQKMDHFIPPPDHLHLLSFPLILPRLDTCQHRFSSEGRLMGSEQGWSPRPSGTGSRSIPAVAGSMVDIPAPPSARLDGRADHQDRLWSPRWASGTAPLLLPTPPRRHLRSQAFPAWGQQPWRDPRSLLLCWQNIFCLLQLKLFPSHPTVMARLGMLGLLQKRQASEGLFAPGKRHPTSLSEAFCRSLSRP